MYMMTEVCMMNNSKISNSYLVTVYKRQVNLATSK